MRRKVKSVVRELDAADVTGYSDNEKKHLLSLGYLPYLMSDGSVKWLTLAQRTYKAARTMPTRSWKTMFKRHTMPSVNPLKQHSLARRFWDEYWSFFLLLIGIGLLIFLIIRYWN